MRLKKNQIFRTETVGSFFRYHVQKATHVKKKKHQSFPNLGFFFKWTDRLSLLTAVCSSVTDSFFSTSSILALRLSVLSLREISQHQEVDGRSDSIYFLLYKHGFPPGRIFLSARLVPPTGPFSADRTGLGSRLGIVGRKWISLAVFVRDLQCAFRQVQMILLGNSARSGFDLSGLCCCELNLFSLSFHKT